MLFETVYESILEKAKNPNDGSGLRFNMDLTEMPTYPFLEKCKTVDLTAPTSSDILMPQFKSYPDMKFSIAFAEPVKKEQMVSYSRLFQIGESICHGVELEKLNRESPFHPRIIFNWQDQQADDPAFLNRMTFEYYNAEFYFERKHLYEDGKALCLAINILLLLLDYYMLDYEWNTLSVRYPGFSIPRSVRHCRMSIYPTTCLVEDSKIFCKALYVELAKFTVYPDDKLLDKISNFEDYLKSIMNHQQNLSNFDIRIVICVDDNAEYNSDTKSYRVFAVFPIINSIIG